MGEPGAEQAAREHLPALRPLPADIRAMLKTLADFCAAHSTDAWLVGGAARDLALGRVPHDLDIAVAADGVDLARAFADQIGAAFVALDDTRGTGRVVYPREQHGSTERLTLDLVRLRAPTLEADLHLRDFSINALALPLAAVIHRQQPERADIIDPTGGLPDLATRTLRPCLPSSLHDDPLRCLRAVRLAAELDLRFAPNLDAALREAVPLIDTIAAERVRDELLRLLEHPGAAHWLREMDRVGLLTRIFPELEPARTCEQPIVHFLPVLGHILETVACLEWLLAPLSNKPDADARRLDQPAALQTYPDLPRSLPFREQWQAHLAAASGGGQPRLALLKLATLLHDNAKPQTKQPKAGGGVNFYGHQTIGADVALAIAKRLKLSRQAANYVARVVREHMRPGNLRAAEHITPRAIARFFRDTEDAGPDVLLHGLADHLAARGPHLDWYDWQHHLAWTSALLDAHWGQPPERQQPLVNGNDLMTALQIEPGPLVGHLLREIHEAQAAGEISTPAEALELARRMIAQKR